MKAFLAALAVSAAALASAPSAHADQVAYLPAQIWQLRQSAAGHTLPA